MPEHPEPPPTAVPEGLGPGRATTPDAAPAVPWAGLPGPADGVGARLDGLAGERAAARRDAASALERRGFTVVPLADGTVDALHPDTTWRGRLPVVGVDGGLAATVRLPAEFPDALPRVHVARAQLPRRMAHVEESGHVCIAPTSGVLLDADRPGDLLEEALDRAARELARGAAGESDVEFQEEWLAYWQPTDAQRTYSICRPDGPARQVVVTRAYGPPPLGHGVDLIAASLDEATAWAKRLGGDATMAGSAFLLPVAGPFPPPEFGEVWTVRQVRALLDGHCEAADAQAVRAYLRAAKLPATVVISMPEAPAGAGRRLAAVRFERPIGATETAATKGFRPGHVPPWRALQVTATAPVARVRLERVDVGYLGARGGAALALAARSVVLVGAGAVGSEIAVCLAALGPGRLTLVDPDVVGPENVHRHALGIRSLWRNKAEALRDALSLHYPHLAIEAVPQRVEAVLAAQREVLIAADMVVVALGEETLERRLNRLLAGGPPRVHAWVEPLGVGGHALACNFRDASREPSVTPGCYECLFAADLRLGLINQAALTGPGQEIRRSLAGCAGTFSPFSALDARRTALEAAELAAAILAAEVRETTLVTWRGDRRTFEEAGYELSRRGRMLEYGTRARVPGRDLARPGCPVCGAEAA